MIILAILAVLAITDYIFIGLFSYLIYEWKVKYSRDQYYLNIRKSRRGLSLRDRSQG
jgi:hypothetical protein